MLLVINGRVSSAIRFRTHDKLLRRGTPPRPARVAAAAVACSPPSEQRAVNLATAPPRVGDELLQWAQACVGGDFIIILQESNIFFSFPAMSGGSREQRRVLVPRTRL